MKKNCNLYGILLAIVLFFLLNNQAQAQLFPPVISPIQGAATVCSQPGVPNSYSVSATNSPYAYSWSTLPASSVIISNPTSSVTNISFPFPNLNATYTLYCSAINGVGSSATTSFVVVVFETPNVTFSGANSFCQGSSTNLSASPTILSSSSTLTYSWMPSTGLSSTTNYSVHAQPPSTTNYSVLLTLGSCTNVAQLTVVVYTCVTGISSIAPDAKEDLLIYPNPNNGVFVLRPAQNELAIILNEIGQTVRSMNLIANTETEISDLPGGIYFVITPSSRKKIIVTR